MGEAPKGFRRTTPEGHVHEAAGDMPEGGLRAADLDRMVAAHGTGAQGEGIVLRCPCHREPLVPFYAGGSIALSCAKSGIRCALVAVAP